MKNVKWTPKKMRWFLNLYPPYFFTGTRIKKISDDWKEVIVVLKKSLLTRNYVGTTFGGSLYAATDPHYMLMLCQILGLQDYIIWDKSADINFIKPVKSDITFHFKLSSDQIETLKRDVKATGKILPEFVVQGVDEEGQICVEVKKVIYIRVKNIQKPVTVPDK